MPIFNAIVCGFEVDALFTAQRLIVEQAFVMAQELETAADSAPEGQVIDRCEAFLLGHGRDSLRRVLEATLQSRAESLEKKQRTAKRLNRR